MMRGLPIHLIAVASILLAPSSARAEEMPGGFVYLRDVDPSIAQDIRYGGADNFTGAAVPGYGARECVLAREAAAALKAVQAALRDKQLSLKVYDCYRPAQAVAAFVAWAKRPDDPAAKAAYYPSLDKSDLFPDYIATRSGHSRGATVDVSLVPLGADDVAAVTEGPCTATPGDRADDGSLAMGTSFDCFDARAHTETPGLSEMERANRQTLVGAMQAAGFKNYPLEWWHFTLDPEPYPDTYFDFPIEPREGD
jgi:D-alanyl-D-alanine dipeptidase